MYYIIQENLFKEYHYNTLVEYLNRYGLEHETVPFRPFTDELVFKTNRKDVFFFGSVNGAKVAEKYNWNPGTLFNDSHDFEVYGPKYGKHLLNWNYVIQKASEPLPLQMPEYFFARPAKDTKSFSGSVFSKGAWEEYVTELQATSTIGQLDAETKILFAPMKSGIQQEIRCWIVDGEPVTISQYKIGERVVYQNHDNNEEAYIFAKDMCKIYCPAKAFVLDICLYQDEYKVVEINCINCSGFYDGNMSKLIQALEKTFGKDELPENNRSMEIVNQVFKDRKY